MRIGSLFSGYGGLDMAVAAHYDATVAWHVEFDKAPSKVLAHHWPDVPNHGDVTAVDWSQVEPVDIITGGYPCQPFSHAGHRRGTNDDRHLWPYVADALRVLRPRVAVFENVAGHLTLGFDTVLADLAALGMDVRWGVVSAAEAGAPHRRERLFIVATDARGETVGQWPGLREGEPAGFGWGRSDDDGSQVSDLTLLPTPRATRGGSGTETSYALGGEIDYDERPQGVVAPGADFGPYTAAITRWSAVLGRQAPPPTEPGTNGRPRLSPRFVEFMMGLPDGWVCDVPGITRAAQLKMLGNGVVPQQALLALSLLDPS